MIRILKVSVIALSIVSFSALTFSIYSKEKSLWNNTVPLTINTEKNVDVTVNVYQSKIQNMIEDADPTPTSIIIDNRDHKIEVKRIKNDNYTITKRFNDRNDEDLVKLKKLHLSNNLSLFNEFELQQIKKHSNNSFHLKQYYVELRRYADVHEMFRNVLSYYYQDDTKALMENVELLDRQLNSIDFEKHKSYVVAMSYADKAFHIHLLHSELLETKGAPKEYKKTL